MKSFLFSCVVIYVRERESNVIRKTAFFHSFLYPQSVEPSVSSPLETETKLKTGREETHPTYAFKKNCRNTRVDSHSHTHALKTFTSSRPRKKKRERERERYVSFARVLFFQDAKEFPLLHLSCPKNRNVARLPSISYQKSPSTYTGDTTTQERIDKYTHI